MHVVDPHGFNSALDVGWVERSATQLIIRMLGYALPPTPLATTLLTRATQWLPNKAIFLQSF
ncbi:MAG: hypothetical protein V7K27_32610 [Nostoc sp.]|uniref:hypothetical protein n=1 Tax=Nostoc sp. TaxID=1180 RepID=UPI002FF92E02